MSYLYILFTLLITFNSYAISFSTTKEIYKKIINSNDIQNPPKLILIKDKSVNAMSNGYKIGINKGMLKFAKNKAEVALVLGHELAHALNLDQFKGGSHPSIEYRADMLGLILAKRAGYNMCQGIEVIYRFNQKGSKTHPASISRYAALIGVCKRGVDRR